MHKLRTFARSVVLLAAIPAPAVGGTLTVAAATNIAGLQRMLIQRVGKAYCQIGLGVRPPASRKQLFEATYLFESQLTQLDDVAPNGQIRRALARVRELWRPVKAAATDPVTREGAKLVAYRTDDLLQAADKVAQLFQEVSDTPVARMVNISGRQRMLSQRLAKFYLLWAWGFDTLTVRDTLRAVAAEFDRAMAELEAAPENTAAIKLRLEAVAREWEWVQEAIAMEGTDFFPTMIANATESILVRMDEITRLYEILGRTVIEHEHRD